MRRSGQRSKLHDPRAAALAVLSPTAAAHVGIAGETTHGFALLAESTIEPNTVIPLVSGGLVDFGGFGSYIEYLLTGVSVQ